MSDVFKLLGNQHPVFKMNLGHPISKKDFLSINKVKLSSSPSRKMIVVDPTVLTENEQLKEEVRKLRAELEKYSQN